MLCEGEVNLVYIIYLLGITKFKSIYVPETIYIFGYNNNVINNQKIWLYI